MAVINGTQFNDFIHRLNDGVPGGGSTEFTTVTSGADTINAGAGNDVVYGDGGNDIINGDDGGDFLAGGQGADTINGGLGNDVIRIQQISDISGLAETIDGGNDLDTLSFQDFSAQGDVNLTLANLLNLEVLLLVGNQVRLTSAQFGAFQSIGGSGLIERLILSDGGLADFSGGNLAGIDEVRGNDLANNVVLTGVALGQTVNLFNGSDIFAGSNGGDTVDGGAGNDNLKGAAGNDTLLGGSSGDTLGGEDGNDILVGGSELDTMLGGVGNDTFRIDLGTDIGGLAEIVDGGLDIDTLDFQTSQVGGNVNLTAAQISSVERLLLGGTQLVISAAQLGEFAEIFGTGLVELIIVGNGTADLTDAFINGIDEIRGTSGSNRITLTDVANGQFVDGRGGDDNITGTIGNDTLYGGVGNDTVNGGAGNDTIRGNEGVDRTLGGSGNDTFQIAGVSEVDGLAEQINGGGDTDTLDFSTLGAFGNVNLAAASITSVEVLRITNLNVTLTAAQLGDFQSIQGSGLVEVIRLAAAGTVDLTDVNIAGIDEFRGTNGADTITLGNASGNALITGGNGIDILTGGTGNDVLDGGAANDTLVGGNGNDILRGGLGRDQLTGGLGVDTFDFNDVQDVGKGAPFDTIQDFLHGQDIIDLQDMDANSEVAGNQQFTFIGAAAFSNVAGQLRYNGGSLVGDFNGDGAADFAIVLTGAPTVTAADLIL